MNTGWAGTGTARWLAVAVAASWIPVPCVSAQADPAARVKEAAALVSTRAPRDALSILQPLLDDTVVTSSPALLADALLETASAYFMLNEYPKALEHYQRARDASRALGDPAREGRSEFGIAQTYKNKGAYPAALEHAREALRLYTRADSPSGIARTHMLTGAILDLTGRHREALASYRTAQPIFEATHDLLAYRILNEIGITLKNLGEYQQALEHYERALAWQLKNDDRYGQAVTLSNMGVAHLLLGQDDRAIDDLQRALALARTLSDRRGQSILLGNIGDLLLDRGQHERAMGYFEQQLQLTQVLGNRNEEANARKSLGSAHAARGELDPARARYEEALAIQREIDARRSEGSTLLSLGELAAREGAPEDAATLASQALTIARETDTPELEWKAHLALARSARDRGRTGDAIAALQASAAIIDDLRANVASDAAKIGFFDERQDVYRELAGALMGAGREVQALEAAEAGRARALADLLEQRHVRAKPSEQEALSLAREAIRQARAERGTGAREAATSAAGSRGTTLDRTLDRLRGEHAELASLITAESPTSAEIAAIARRLDATILEYFVTERELLAWVISPAGEIHGRAIDATRDRMATLAERLRGQVERLDVEALGSPAAAREDLRELHRLLIAPLRGWLPQSAGALVLIVPHGPLATLPFAALEDETGEPLVARHTLMFAPSVSVFRYTPAKRNASTAEAAEALVIADPAPPGDSGLSQLTGAREEGRRVATRLAGRGRLLTGANASEAAVKREAGAHRILHFATHGLVSPERPLASSLVLAEGGGEDGFLRVDEIFSLPLAAELVVLSGCSTGLGRMSGEGIIGLSRAFIYAGTPSIVVSQWDVSDRATADLMDAFYRELQRGAGKAAALRTAQLETRRRYPAPAVWAPFILVGEPD